MEQSSTTLICPRCGRESPGPLGTLCPDDSAACISKTVYDALGERPDRIIGRVVAGRFPVVGLIGRGAYGTVYRAIQLPIGREVALKVMNTPRDAALRARFFREANVVARLSHPATVTLFDYGEDQDGLLWMVLELIRGQTLRDVLLEEAPLAPARAARLTLQMLGALVEAHGAGLVHRDLKPANIMLTREQTGDERAKVLDFGMAKVLEAHGFGDGDEATRTGLVVGTPRYLSPEQALARQVGPQTDVYAMGVILYEMLAGEPPFVAPSTFELLVLHTTAEIPKLDLVLKVPPAMQAIIDRAMAKAVEDRFPDAQAMLDALRLAASGAPTTAAARRTPRPAEGAVDPAELSADDLRSVARQARRILPDSPIAANLRSNRPALRTRARSTAPPPAQPPTPAPVEQPSWASSTAPPPGRLSTPGPSTFQPPPLAPDALDHGMSATHGELNRFVGTDEYPAPGRGRLGVGLVAAGLVALGLAGWMLWGPPDRSSDALPPDRAALRAATVPIEAAEPGKGVAEPDAAPRAADRAVAFDPLPPPDTRALQSAIRDARRAVIGHDPGAPAAVTTVARQIEGQIAGMADDEEKAAWNLERADLLQRLAETQADPERRASLLAARADLAGAMTYGSREKNFEYFTKGVELSVKLFGDLAGETLAFACDPAHVGAYLHRGNVCAIMQIRAGQAVQDSDPDAFARLVCAGAERFTAELPNLSAKRLAHKQREKRDYGAQCNLARQALSGR